MPILAALAVVACDDDPSASSITFPTARFVNTDTVGRQEAIRVVFSDSVSAATALDPANFIVTNLCTGLRIPGSLRLAGDTLIFSPGQTLPFLTPISVRVQNLLTPDGLSQPQPLTARFVTEAPPVRDVSWEFLNSPTGFTVSGLQFADRDVGYLISDGGEVYATNNGGLTYGARFKDVNITVTNGLQVMSRDTLFMVGALIQGSNIRFPIFRSTNGGLSFDTLASVSTFLIGLDMQKKAGGGYAGVLGGQFVGPEVYRFDSPNTIVAAPGIPTSNLVFGGIALASDAQRAAVALYGQGPNVGRGDAAWSADGGRTYSAIALPANTKSLRGAGFRTNTEAFLLGDSSTVMRVNLAGASPVITSLGAANGIPQTIRDTVERSVTTFSFRRAEFVTGGQIGWIAGIFVRDFQDTQDISGGVIMMTRDGGQTWTRQAIRTAPENGLRFPPIFDLQAMANDFAAVGGQSGLVAARKSDIQTVQECTFNSN